MPAVTIKDISVQLSELIKLVVETQHDLGSKIKQLEKTIATNKNSIQLKLLSQEENFKKEIQLGHDKSYKRLSDRVDSAHNSVLTIFKESLDHHFKSTSRQVATLRQEIDRNLRNV